MYHCLTIDIPPEPRENVANLAFEHGATGLEETETGLNLYFDNLTTVESFQKQLPVYLQEYEELNRIKLEYALRMEELPPENWNRSWQESWQPTVAGGFIVHPPWIEPGPAAGMTPLAIHPRMAFGTGTHPTTRLLLTWLDRMPPSGCNLLDAGCGSGILAIAAIKRNAAFALGIDIEPEAVENARENARLNSVSHETWFRELRPFQLDASYRFERVLANMLFHELEENLEELSRLTLSGGELWLSGVLAEEADKLRKLTAALPLIELESEEEGEWLAIRFRRGE